MLSCPYCACLDRLYRSRRRWYHFVQRLVRLRRYFCDACGRRFWSWQPGPQPYGPSAPDGAHRKQSGRGAVRRPLPT